MAKKKRKIDGGPYLAAAFFCEQVIESKDGSLSAIRIIDQIQVAIPANLPADVPSKENRVAVNMAGLLSFKTGYARPGQHTVRVIMRSPSGKKNQTSPPLVDNKIT